MKIRKREKKREGEKKFLVVIFVKIFFTQFSYNFCVFLKAWDDTGTCSEAKKTKILVEMINFKTKC